MEVVSSRSLSGDALINLRWYRPRRGRKEGSAHFARSFVRSFVRSFQIQGWSRSNGQHINRASPPLSLSLSHPLQFHHQKVNNHNQ